MNARLPLIVGSLVQPILTAESVAQIVGPQRQVNLPGQVWQEASIAARLGFENEVCVSAQDAANGSNEGVFAVVSFDGGISYSIRQFFDANVMYADSGLALDRATDRIWLSGLPGHVAWRNPGLNQLFTTPYQSAAIEDKPLMAIGPAPGGGGPTHHYLVYQWPGPMGLDPPNSQYVARSTDPMSGQVWPFVARVEPKISGPPTTRAMARHLLC